MKRRIQYQIRNDAAPKASPRNHVRMTVKNLADLTSPLEVNIYDEIGKDDYTGAGFSASDFVDAIKGADNGTRELKVRVNSRGGVVSEGIAIYNRMREWSGPSVAIVDGDAASIASVLIMGAKEVRMPKSAQILIHEAHAMVFANTDAAGLRQLVDELEPQLEAASNRIANIYAERSGKSAEEMRAYMRKTTVFSGSEAKAIGLCDVCTDDAPIYNLTAEEISNFRRETEAANKTKNNPEPKAGANNNIMNRAEIIALLTEHGVTFDTKATDAELSALLKTTITNLAKTAKPPATPPVQASAEVIALNAMQKQMEAVNARFEAQNKVAITAVVDALIENNQVTASERDKAILRAMKDETYLDELRARPVQKPGAEPVRIDVTNSDPRDIGKAFEKTFGRNLVNVTDKKQMVLDARQRGIERAQLWNSAEKRLMPFIIENANTVSSTLQRVAILQGVSIRAFARRLLPLTAFSTVLNGIVPEGTGNVTVPYMPLDGSTATEFNQTNGYVMPGVSNSSGKTIAVTQSAGGFRKYVPYNFNSDEFRRQPYLNVANGFAMKAEVLAATVFAHVLSIVLRATYGQPVKTKAAIAFNADDISDIKGACTRADWPDAGRSIIMDSDYEAALTKDAQLVGSLDPEAAAIVRTGMLPMIKGFQPYVCPRIPSNGENLAGFAAYMSAILFAQAPIEPTAEVMNQLSSYEVIVDPQTGAAFEYRRWGNPDIDETRAAIECNYGFAAGETAALKIIASA